MSETRTTHNETAPHEIEQKFIPIFPEQLHELRKQARPIEQFYLSHPSEPFSLRMREELDESGELVYTATLKDRGTLTDAGIDRLEVEVPVTADVYQYYKSDETPVLRKLRATPLPDIAVDFYDLSNDHIQVESENPAAWQQFTTQFGESFIDMTWDYLVDNEKRAYMEYWRTHPGSELAAKPTTLSTDAIVRDVLRAAHDQAVIIALQGRSGSGKSTLVRELQQKLHDHALCSEVISTDDYHRGAAWLRDHNNGQAWTHWDAPEVYDTKRMAEDIDRLRSGETIPRRLIDFSDCSPVITGEIKPAPVIIIEGIYAGSHDFDRLKAHSYEMPTPLATCIGRRLLRDMRERPEFADPEKSLAYMLCEAEPAWRAQNS